MARRSSARVRVAGFILSLLAGILLAIGFYLIHLALNWQMPLWVPEDLLIVPQGTPLPLTALRDTPLGLAAGYVAAFGAVAGLNALWMLLFGRRNRLLVAVLILFFLVFVIVGVWAALDNGQQLGQIGG